MRKYKKNNLVLYLILFIGLLGIGFALLSQDLTINGISTVKGNEWDIHFDNVQINSNSVPLQTNDKAASIDLEDNTLVEYRVTLSTPGDFYEFTVDAVNAGSIDGMIGEIISQLNGSPISSENPLPSYLNYSVTYSDGVAIAPNHLLEAGATETYKVRLEFKKDIDESTLPATDQSNTFSFGVNYVQKESSAIRVPHPETIYTMNVADIDDVNAITVKIGQAIPNTISQYNNTTDVKSALNTRATGTVFMPMYLKHTISNDVVTDSYVEFEISEAIANNNPGMTAGVYSIQGGGANCTWDSNTDEIACEGTSPYYNSNKEVLQRVFGSGNCEESNDNGIYFYECSNDILNASIYSQGLVSLREENSSYYCMVSYNGSSFCAGLPSANINGIRYSNSEEYYSPYLKRETENLYLTNEGLGNVYKKYVFNNGEIEEYYLEFIISEEMANANSGMTAGTYDLTNAESYYSPNDSILESAFGSSNCIESTHNVGCGPVKYYTCSIENLKIEITGYGGIYALNGEKRVGIFEQVICG